MYKKALISVSNKRGLKEFLKPLVQQGLKIVSTGGTGQFLKSKGFAVQDVEGLTGFPEVLSGRVKSLHPHIHICLLARHWKKEDQDLLKQYGLEPFDLVVGQVYPFEEQDPYQDEKELAEWIDVGGPAFLRAAAKNYFSVTVLCCPEDYSKAQKGTDLQGRKLLASKVFERLSRYDATIANRLKQKELYQKRDPAIEAPPASITIKGSFFKSLRYGENPHQQAHWFTRSQQGLHSAIQLMGKDLSYNNLLDFQTAVSSIKGFKEPCAVAVKHNNPCGMALSHSISMAVEQVLKADPLSVFGGILAFNRPLDLLAVEKLSKVFLEGLIAPDFSSSALENLKNKKKLIVLKWPEMFSFSGDKNSFTEIMGGFLSQTRDFVPYSWSENWKLIGNPPSEEQKKDLLLAWKISAHLKSNAIAIVKGGQSLGLGMGQVSRVSAVRLALQNLKEFHPGRAEDLTLASDGFFPFPDSIDLAGQGGLSWIIQPGGSLRDKEVLKKAKEWNINMVLTGQRHFKH